MDDPKQMLWNIFLCISLGKYTKVSRPIKENVIVFFHHNYDYFILCNN